jgi:hypothetical protein
MSADFSKSAAEAKGDALGLVHRRLALLTKTGQQHYFSIDNREDGVKRGVAVVGFGVNQKSTLSQAL